jgi:hypothetical protein
MGKRFIFRHYWWIAIVVAAIAVVVIVVSKALDRAGLIGATIGAALGFCYFAQRQKLDELRLFRDLFTDFSCRYDEMNEKLENILTGNQIEDSKLRKTLVDYFNLCAEEYLFYDEGFIHRAAWRSWCLGMLYYLKDERIRKIWNNEVGRDSYYGLTLDVVQKGANLPGNSPRA